MNLPNTKTIHKLDYFFILLILGFTIVYAIIAVTSDYRDTNRSPQWRMQHGWDEGQNVARALSIVKYGYRENPVLKRDQTQFYLMLAAIGQNFFSKSYDLPSRITLALRVGSTFSLCLYFLLFYVLCRMATNPFSSFISWLCFFSASWEYLPIGTSAKEDAFCDLLTICIILCFVSLFQKSAAWKRYLCALLIGLGGATKQYPLLLSVVFPLYFWKSGMDKKTVFYETLKMGITALFVFILVTPNFYLSKAQLDTKVEEIFFSTQSHTGLKMQLLASWEVLKEVVFLRYKEFFVALLLLAGLNRIQSPAFKNKGTIAYRFLLQNKWQIVFFFLFYYGISLYKQNYHVSVRYFMVGEILYFLLFSILLERLLQLESVRLKTAVLILLAMTATLNFRRGDFNRMIQTSAVEQSIREKKHSVFDDLETYLRELTDEQRKTILSHWYVYIPPEFRPKYVHKIEFGYSYAEVYLEREYGFSVINALLDPTLVARERPTLFLSLFPLHEDKDTFIGCFSLVRTFKAMEPVLYSNYFTALLSLYQTEQNLIRNEDKFPLPAGSTVYVYDTRSCFQK